MYVELCSYFMICMYILFTTGLQIKKKNHSFISNIQFNNIVHEQNISYLKKKQKNKEKYLAYWSERKRDHTRFKKHNRCIEQNGEAVCDNDKGDHFSGTELEEGEWEDHVDARLDNDHVDARLANEQCSGNRLELYEKLFNVEENSEYTVLSPKYNMNIYNILEKNYDEKENNKKIILKINNLNYEIDNKKIISNLNFELKKSECVGLIGNNGCGKTTLLNLIFENADNRSKNIIILNNQFKKENVEDVILNEDNICSLIKKNNFTVLYKILSYMANNSLNLSSLPTLIKNLKNLDLGQLDKNWLKNNNQLFFKNEVFYFKQNIHLLQNNDLTVFEKVLNFYQRTLQMYEVLMYIERSISIYNNDKRISQRNGKEEVGMSTMSEGVVSSNREEKNKLERNDSKSNGTNGSSSVSTDNFSSNSNSSNSNSSNSNSSNSSNSNSSSATYNSSDKEKGRKNSNPSDRSNGKLDHYNCSTTNLEKSSDTNNGKFTLCNGKNEMKLSKEEQDFINSKYFDCVLKLYMHEKEHVFKEINNIKMNFNKYVNILNLKNFVHVKMCHLSNGYIIRVYLLLLLLSNSKLLLIDEINNNLDIFNIFFIMNIFKYALKYKQIGIILASHDFFLVSKLCSSILDFNKIYGYDMDLNNMALLKKISKGSNTHRRRVDDTGGNYGIDASYNEVYNVHNTHNSHKSKTQGGSGAGNSKTQSTNLTYFKGNYVQYLNNMKILFDNKRKKKEELKKILDQLSANISKAKKKNKKEFMQQSLKKKEEELKLYQNIYDNFFDSKLNYQYMYYNLIYSKKNKNKNITNLVCANHTKENSSASLHKKERMSVQRNVQVETSMDGENTNARNTNDVFNNSLQFMKEVLHTNNPLNEGTGSMGASHIAEEEYRNRYKNDEANRSSSQLTRLTRFAGGDSKEMTDEDKIKYNERVEVEKMEHSEEQAVDDQEDIKSFMYGKMNDVEGNMNKNILIDMSRKIKNSELIETGEKYGTNNVTLYDFNNFSFYFLNKKNKKKKYIFKNMSLSINRGENVLLLGKNGIGKSTFFKILTNEYNLIVNENKDNFEDVWGKKKKKKKKSLYAYGDDNDNDMEEEKKDISTEIMEQNKMAYFEGTINCNFNNVLLTYFEQNMIKKLNLEINDYFKYIIERVRYQPVNFYDQCETEDLFNEHFFFYVLNKTKPFCNDVITNNIEEKIKALLKIFYIDSSTSIKEKSGGEKVRILFLSLFLKKSNLLLLDEINNNLDIYLKNLLLHFLNFIYEGNYILTTHDFYIIKNLTNVHKIIYIFDYLHTFTFYNVQDFIYNFYNFILTSFNILKYEQLVDANKKENEKNRQKGAFIVNSGVRNKSTIHPEQLFDSSRQTINNNNGNSNNDEISCTAKYDTDFLSNFYEKNANFSMQSIDQYVNRDNYEQHLYDSYDYEILKFLKAQYDKDRNERNSYEQINNVQEEIFEQPKANKKNFGGKGSSGKIKIKNWKRWRK
ncbi:ABC transporter F family member 1, putative [Plasmodium malariae]|uniref:ABC transporter F family member 1, putative n=1 Tax=Plasmodium malariae TaxID=5858 RepID=A0A1C3L2I7_PLAMA|nr:ABC transporter F family member 1, putative [Plasmodium malariae]